MQGWSKDGSFGEMVLLIVMGIKMHSTKEAGHLQVKKQEE